MGSGKLGGIKRERLVLPAHVLRLEKVGQDILRQQSVLLLVKNQ